MGGLQGLYAYLTSSLVLATEGKDVPLEERRLIQTFILLSRTLLAKDPSATTVQLYVLSISIMGSLAARKQGTAVEPAGSDAWREATFKELRGALDKYRDVIIERYPLMLIVVNLASAKVVRTLGRFQEAVALARQELPAIEALSWGRESTLLLVDYYRTLGVWIAHGDGAGRSLLLDFDVRCDDKATIEQSMEAEVMFKKAIELADKNCVLDQAEVGPNATLHQSQHQIYTLHIYSSDESRVYDIPRSRRVPCLRTLKARS
jgi:hypothetical protein